MVFMHNMGEKEPGSKGRVKGCVAIILSLKVVIAWGEAGSKPLITTLLKSSFAGRFFGVKLQFTKVDQCGKKKRGYLKLLLASVYHQVDDTKHEGFNYTLNPLINYMPNLRNLLGDI